MSTLDLVRYDGFTLIAGRDGQAWIQAAQGMPEVTTLVAGRDFADAEGSWATVSEVGPTGAILVRPDQHVAWRAPAMVGDPAPTLAAVLDKICGNSAARASSRIALHS